MPIAVYALSLAAFAVGTAEFIISGILPALAADLGVTIPTAGLLVTAYALGVAVGGPLLSLVSGRLAPRTVMLGVMVLFVVSQLLCALAQGYTMLLAARLVSAAGHGVFFGVGSVIVSRLVPAERRGRAFSLFVGGLTVAMLLGLPAGTAIGNGWGWRASFVAVGIAGAVAVVALTLRLPGGSAASHGEQGVIAQLRALRHQQVWLSYIIIAVTMVGALAFGTYQVAILLEVTKIEPAATPLYLLLSGVGAVAGIWLGGRLTDWRAMPSLIVVLLAQAVCYAGYTLTMAHPVPMAINLFLGGAFGFAFSTPLQARVIGAAQEAPNLAASLISSAFNVGIAAGALLGAVLLTSGMGYAQLPLVGVVTSLAGASLAALSLLLERRSVLAARA